MAAPSAHPEGDVVRVHVPADAGGERLDAVLAQLTGLSRTRIHDLMAAGKITSRGSTVKKSDRAVAGREIQVDESVEESLPPTPFAGEVPVLWIDDHVVVIDKPAELAVHPAPSWDGDTVVEVLQRQGVSLANAGLDERPGVVQRLDVGTSGVMILARSEAAYIELKRCFHDREVTKIYHALVQGYPSPSSGTIDAPIGRHPSSSWRFAVVTDGKPAVTHYDTVEVYAGATLVEVRLETGRTHQIRVHFQAERHPLVGDALYGADPTFAASLGLSRQWLHSWRLELAHPVTGEPLSVEAPYPDDLRQSLETLSSSH